MGDIKSSLFFPYSKQFFVISETAIRHLANVLRHSLEMITNDASFAVDSACKFYFIHFYFSHFDLTQQG